MSTPEQEDFGTDSSVDHRLARYQRQMLLPPFGPDGQTRLMQTHALVVGCGALGCMVIDLLARAGVGTLTIVDRDFVEITNLQRQILYGEHDVAENLPKAEAARRRIASINSTVHVRAIIDDVNHRNIERILSIDSDRGINVIVDGLDNFETRYLLNDVSVQKGLPYVYGGAVATGGMTATFLPRSPASNQSESNTTPRAWNEETQSTPCLRCVFPEAPPPGSTPTCDTAGVLGPIVTTIASMQAAEAIKILLGEFDAINRDLVTIDLWRNESRRLHLSSMHNQHDCLCCGKGHFDYLSGKHAPPATSLCGRNAVQIAGLESESDRTIDLESMAARLQSIGPVNHNEFMLRVQVPEPKHAPCEITLFPNGRAIVHGTDDPAFARSLYARYIGA